MTARTSWSVRAKEPHNRDIDAGPAADHRPLLADLLDSRFDESGRIVRRGADARSRVAERLGRDLPDVGAEDLEEAVARLSRQVAAAAQAGAAQRAEPAQEPERQRPERPPAEGELDAESRHHPAGRDPGILEVIDRLEARLQALSEQAGRRPAAGRGRDEPEAPAPAKAAGEAQTEPITERDRATRDRLPADEEIATRHSAAHEGARGAVEEALDSLARRIEALDRNDRSLARAMEAIHGQLGEVCDGLAGRQATGGEELALIAERLEALGERLAAAELGPSALAAVERSFEHLLERIGSLERAAERGTPPAELWDRLERLRRHLQALPGQEALSSLEDRVLALAERIDAAFERGADGRAIERLEGQLDQMVGALAGLKQAEQARARDIEARLADLLRRVETAPRGAGQAEMAAIQSRLDELLARIDGTPAPLFAEAIASLEARIDGLGKALEERPAVDLDPLSRQLRDLQVRLDKVGRAVTQAGSPAAVDIEPLNRRLEEIQQRLEAAPPASPADGELGERLRAIEERLAGLSHAAAPDLEPVRDQLALLAERLDGVSPAEQPDTARMTALMERLETLLQMIGGEDQLAGIGVTIGKVSAALDAMSDAPALEDIAELRTEIALLRREMRSLPGGEAAASEELAPLLKDLVARLDRQPTATPLTMADLEAQIDRIVVMMEEPAPDGALGSIEESLRRIEEQLESGSRAALPSAAARMEELDEGAGDGFTRLVSALSADLSALKETASSSQHNMRETLEAVHGTLEGVARRIAALEGQGAVVSAASPASAPVEPPRGPAPARPAAAPADPAPRPAPIPEIALKATGTERPASDAAPAAGHPSAGSQGLLGRLTSGQLLRRATGGRAESFSPAADEVDDGSDLPLEPGTEEPMSSTLENAPSSDTALFTGPERRRNRIPGRAGAVNRRSDDSGYVANDFLSAARRAAQAAAVEAAETERMVDTDDQIGALQRLFGAMKARRRVILAGALAIAVAFAALQFLEMRGGEESRLPRTPVAETGDNGLAGRTAGEPAARDTVAGDPSRPDSRLAFGEPSVEPGELQRRSPGAAEETAGAAAEQQETVAPPPAEAWPPGSIGPERLRQAAAEGDPAAQFEVAARYAEGRGVTQDLEEAAEWYRRAAEGGLAPAQYRLGSIYEKGIGVPKDPAAALEWYRRAAEAGNAKAMHNLAVLYAEGAGGNADLERAAEWFRRAAEHGVRDSQFNIGVLYARGLGVPQDVIEAYKWFAVAAQSGDSQAEERRNLLAQSMAEDDLIKARAAAAAFRPLILDPAANVVDQPEGGWGDPPPANVSLGGPDLVRQVQDLLAARGYDVGPADGRMGPRTRQAVAAFQEELGLPATGDIDPGVVVALQQRAD